MDPRTFRLDAGGEYLYSTNQTVMNDPHFESTQWSEIRAAADGSDPAKQREALDRLLRVYMPALKAHLVLRKKIAEDAADDFLQDFVSKKILETDLLLLADPSKGKFRTLLLTVLDRMIIDYHRRGRLPTEPLAADQVFSTDSSADVDLFEMAWAWLVVFETVKRYLEECRSKGQPKTWAVFVELFLKPFVDNDKTPLDEQQKKSIRQFAESPSFEDEKAVQNMRTSANRKFRRLVDSVIEEYVHGREDIKEEATALLKMLKRPESYDLPLHLMATQTDRDTAALLKSFSSHDVSSLRELFSDANGESPQ